MSKKKSPIFLRLTKANQDEETTQTLEVHLKNSLKYAITYIAGNSKLPFEREINCKEKLKAGG